MPSLHPAACAPARFASMTTPSAFQPPSPVLRFLWQAWRWVIDPRIFAPIAALLYLSVTLADLHHNATTDKGRQRLVEGDARHYVLIATELASGNFSMDYVKERPHRQPLFPAVLAPAVKLSHGDLFWMGATDVVLATLAFLLIYFGLLALGFHRAIAAFIGLLYLGSPFLEGNIPSHIMTESLHIFLMIAIIIGLLFYLQAGRAWQLLTIAALVGLDYLTRPNGLFVMAAMMGSLGVRDLFELAARWPDWRWLLRRFSLYLGAIALFIAVTMPSWVPRLMIYGNPIYHGYLSNFMWVDSYDEGHGQNLPVAHFSDYARNHTAWDAVKRMAYGVWNVGFDVPRRTEGKRPLLFLFSFAGFWMALVRGPSRYRVLALFGTVQLLPLMWTHLSNPTIRVPYAATFPFELFFAGLLLAYLAGDIRPLVVRFLPLLSPSSKSS